MFKTLDEVSHRWQELYDEFQWRQDKLTTPGYSNDVLERLEQAIGIKLHSTFRNIVLRFNFDTMAFNTTCFAGRRDYIDTLREIIPNTRLELPDNFLQIGFADASVIVLNNETGEIYIADDISMQPIKVARNLEAFICIAATIRDTHWPGLITKNRYGDDEWWPNSETDKAIETFYQDNEIQDGHEFWEGLVKGLY